jgi:WD40 repeat protein
VVAEEEGDDDEVTSESTSLDMSGDSDSSAEREREREGEGEGASSDDESVEGKRARLAAAYVARLKESRTKGRGAEGEREGESDDGVDESDEEEGGDEQLAAALASSAAAARSVTIADLATRLPPSLSPTLVRTYRTGSSTPSGRPALTAILSVACGRERERERAVVAAGKNGSIVLYAAATGRRLSTVVLPVSSVKRRSRAATASRSPPVTCLGAVDELRLLGVGAGDGVVRLYSLADPTRPTLVRQFIAHAGAAVTGVGFSSFDVSGAPTCLVTSSADATVKLWGMDEEMVADVRAMTKVAEGEPPVVLSEGPRANLLLLDTLFGHQTEVTCLAVAPKRKRAKRSSDVVLDNVTTGSTDATVRLWKPEQGNQLVFRPPPGVHIECVTYLTRSVVASGCSDGVVRLWSTTKRNAVAEVQWTPRDASQRTAVPEARVAVHSQTLEPTVTAIAAVPFSDLLVVGYAGPDPVVVLYAVTYGKGSDAHFALTQRAVLPVDGVVASLALVPADDHLSVFVAVSREQSRGRWGVMRHVKPHVVQHRFELNESS